MTSGSTRWRANWAALGVALLGLGIVVAWQRTEGVEARRLVAMQGVALGALREREFSANAVSRALALDLAAVGGLVEAGVAPDDAMARQLEWTLRSHAHEHVVQAHRGRVAHVAIAPDLAWIASASEDEGEGVRLWDPATGVRLAELVPSGGGALRDLSVSHDGGRVLARFEAEGASSITVWDPLRSAVVFQTAVASELDVEHAALSPDGSTVTWAETGDAVQVRVHDVASGRQRRTLTLTPSDAGLALSTPCSATRVLTWREHEEPVFWDVATGQPTRLAIEGNPRAIACLGTHTVVGIEGSTDAPDGLRLVSWDETGARTVRSASGPPAHPSRDLGPGGGIEELDDCRLAVGADGERVAFGCDVSWSLVATVGSVWSPVDVSGCARGHVLPDATGGIAVCGHRLLAWDGDGHRVDGRDLSAPAASVASARERGLFAWGDQKGRLSWGRPPPPAVGVADRYLERLEVTSGGWVGLWPGKRPPFTGTFDPTALGGAPCASAVTPSGDVIVLWTGLCVGQRGLSWTHARRQEGPSPARLVVRRPNGEVEELWRSEADGVGAISADGSRVAVAEGSASCLRIMDLPAGETRRLCGPSGAPPRQLELSLDGATLAVRWANDAIDIARITASEAFFEPRPPWGHALPPSWIALSPDGSELAVGGGEGQEGAFLDLWNTSGSGPATPLDPPTDTPNQVAWSRDGSHLAAGYRGGVSVWELATASRSAHDTNPSGVRSLQWSPDGTRLVWTDGASAVVADALARPVASLRLRGVTLAAFSPDGSELYVAAGELIHRISTAAPGLERARAEAGAATNYRVCRETLEVVAVVPFPQADEFWAPPQACSARSAP